MSRRTISLFDDQRLSLDESVEMTALNLRAYGERYKRWVVAYSGGKDSTALLVAVHQAIERGLVPRPESLHVLYADTRQELPPLQLGAMQMLEILQAKGVQTQVVQPAMDDRYFVYMFGRGVPPPNNGTLRWCTAQLKIEPMQAALQELRDQTGEKLLMLTGVRQGESAVRDARIAVSCSKNGSECGQGWFQTTTPAAIADTLAPILHWRVCLVWDYLLYASTLGYPTKLVATVYGGDEAEELNARTGCIGCPLATKDLALDNLIKLADWSYLAPLKRLRPLYVELRRFEHRLRKRAERNQDGKLSSNPERVGPLTMEARLMGLREVLDVQAAVNSAAIEQGRPQIDLINQEEHRRILELIAANTWPQRWTGDEPRGDTLLPQSLGEGMEQPLLIELEGYS